MKPKGALSRDELHKGRLYYVWSDTKSYSRWKGQIDIEDFDHVPRPGSGFFNGDAGYIFDNYFHALAYSLKVKSEANEKQKTET